MFGALPETALPHPADNPPPRRECPHLDLSRIVPSPYHTSYSPSSAPEAASPPLTGPSELPLPADQAADASTMLIPHFKCMSRAVKKYNQKLSARISASRQAPGLFPRISPVSRMAIPGQRRQNCLIPHPSSSLQRVAPESPLIRLSKAESSQISLNPSSWTFPAGSGAMTQGQTSPVDVMQRVDRPMRQPVSFAPFPPSALHSIALNSDFPTGSIRGIPHRSRSARRSARSPSRWH